MHLVTWQALREELEKIAGAGYDQILKSGLGRLARSAEGAVEAGVGRARMPFIPVRGPKVVGQEVRQMMGDNRVRGALKLRGQQNMELAQKAQGAYKDIDRLGIEGGTVSPARSVLTDVGRGVRTPRELAATATSIRDRIVRSTPLPSPAPVRKTLTGQLVPQKPAVPVGPTTGKFVPQRSGVFPSGSSTGLQPPASVAA